MFLCSTGKSSGIPRIAGQFMKANRNWLREQLDTIVDHVNNPYVSLYYILIIVFIKSYTQEHWDDVIESFCSHLQCGLCPSDRAGLCCQNYCATMVLTLTLPGPSAGVSGSLDSYVA